MVSTPSTRPVSALSARETAAHKPVRSFLAALLRSLSAFGA
jgi:hypothetical protein